MLNLSNLNKQCLIAQNKMNSFSWAWEALQYSYGVDSFVYIGMISSLGSCLLFQYSVDVDLFHFGWVSA